MTGPLARRRAALAADLDEDAGSDWSPSELAALAEHAIRAEAQRDHWLQAEGEALLAEYQAGDGSMAAAFFRFARARLNEPTPPPATTPEKETP